MNVMTWNETCYKTLSEMIAVKLSLVFFCGSSRIQQQLRESFSDLLGNRLHLHCTTEGGCLLQHHITCGVSMESHLPSDHNSCSPLALQESECSLFFHISSLYIIYIYIYIVKRWFRRFVPARIHSVFDAARASREWIGGLGGFICRSCIRAMPGRLWNHLTL